LSNIHSYFQFWCKHGFFEVIWISGLKRYDEIQDINWSWLGKHGCMTKAPLSQESVENNPTDRKK